MGSCMGKKKDEDEDPHFASRRGAASRKLSTVGNPSGPDGGMSSMPGIPIMPSTQGVCQTLVHSSDAPKLPTFDVGVESRQGYEEGNPRKTNQDNYAIAENLGSSDIAFFGCFDGHGAVGHDVSKYIRERLPVAVAIALNDVPSPAASDIHKALDEAFVISNEDLNASPINTTFSGCTNVSILLMGGKFYCANAGDSRCVLAQNVGGKLMAKDLSVDNKPDDPKEKARIESSGGRVAPMEDQGEFFGPHRVWLKNKRLPGLAMSRAMGDTIAASVGVLPNPEIVEHDYQPGVDKFMILASDGVWEFLESQKVIDHMSKFLKDGPDRMAKEIVALSSKMWKQEEEGVRDDITAVVLVFKD